MEREIDENLDCSLSVRRVKDIGSMNQISFPEGRHIRNLDPLSFVMYQLAEKASILVQTTADVPPGSYILYVHLEFGGVNVRDQWITINVTQVTGDEESPYKHE